MSRTRFALVLSVAAAPLAAQTRPTLPIDTTLLAGVARDLSHDSLRGRATGSPGAEAAARIIIGRLGRIGVPGGIDGGYVQAVPLTRLTILPDTRLTVWSASDSTSFAYGRDFVYANAGLAAFRDFAGEPIFLGTLANAAQALGDEPVRGRVLVLLGWPDESADSLVAAWHAAGATAVIGLAPDSALFAAFAGRDTRWLVDAAIEEPVWQPALPVMVGGPALAWRLLGDAPLPPGARAGRPFPAVPLQARIRATLQTRRSAVDAANIAGIVRGSDPALSDELVVFTAHYDHLGTGEPDTVGDSIYNGFSDNAAGVAILLAIADALVKDPPPRSALFLFTTGEEQGLLGSSFAAAPGATSGLDRATALINIDGGAPPRPPLSWRIAGGLETGLGQLAARVAGSRGWTVTLSGARPNSDHWPFAIRGVPSIFIIPGDAWEHTLPEERAALRQRWDRYHRPGDEWSPDFPMAGLARYAEFALAVGRAAAGQR